MRYSLKRSRWPDNIHQIDSGRHEKHRDRESGSLPSIDMGALSVDLSFLTRAIAIVTRLRTGCRGGTPGWGRSTPTPLNPVS